MAASDTDGPLVVPTAPLVYHKCRQCDETRAPDFFSFKQHQRKGQSDRPMLCIICNPKQTQSTTPKAKPQPQPGKNVQKHVKKNVKPNVQQKERVKQNVHVQQIHPKNVKQHDKQNAQKQVHQHVKKSEEKSTVQLSSKNESDDLTQKNFMLAFARAMSS